MVKSATLSDGTNVECSLVIVGIGARPNVELFAGQLDTLSAAPGGIKVDGQLRTSDDSVWAIGDVAAFPQTLTSGKLMRQEHVTNCRESAAFVMASVMGEKPADYEYLPFFYSRVFQYSWQFYGQNSGLPVHFGNQENAKFGAFWVDDGKIVGGFYEGGSPEDFSALKAIVSKQPEAPSDLGVLGLSLASRL
jgi:monodehydroascorbate reductase (NADH)